MIVEGIPSTAEYKSRLQYARAMHSVTFVEMALTNGDAASAHQLVTNITGESKVPKRLVRWCAARGLTIEALSEVSFADWVDRLRTAAARLRAVVSRQLTDHRSRTVEAYCRTLEL